MGELRCVDSSLLGVAAVPCRDRAGRPYDVTLRLVLDRQPFAIVGQRCGHQLAALAAQVQAAREDPAQQSCWPDPDDRFPVPGEAGGPAGLPAGFQPGEREYFTLRSRNRGDLPGGGEIRCLLRSSAHWLPAAAPPASPAPASPAPGSPSPARPAVGGAASSPGGPVRSPGGPVRAPGGAAPGHWRLSRRAVLEAWGDSGTGVRAVLTSAELVTFLDTVLSEPDVGAPASSPSAVRTAECQQGRLGRPTSRQRGRVPDGSARSRLPALRAAARSVALAVGNPQARGSDVRR